MKMFAPLGNEIRRQAVIDCMDVCISAAESVDRAGWEVAKKNLRVAIADFDVQCAGIIDLHGASGRDLAKLNL